jgi:Ca2+-transporting ATPase
MLFESLHLEANEASLTGESMPVEKNAHDEDKKHIFLGTIIVKGRAKALVETTGMQTKFGGIAASLSNIAEEETPLQKKLDTLGKQLGGLALTASAIVFFIGYFSHQPLIEMILTSISLAVAAVPEGLPAVITITLAIGMQRMAKKKAILRKLSSIEALGSTTIIATDKTGTLTKNEMRVVSIWTHVKTEHAMHELLTTGVLCNNASLVYKEDHSSYDVLGDTTEGALLLLAADKGVDADQLKLNGSIVEEYAFDPTLKLMSVVWKNDGTLTIYTKGAPESVLATCSRLTAKEKETIEQSFQEYASQGLRVIALAQKTVRHVPKTRDDAESDLTFIGFVGIADPAREEVKDAIAIAQTAGIKTIMITGDNELTARAIGAKIGLLQKGDEVITGSQFSQLSDQKALERLPVIRIFARTTPDQKLRIVQLLQRMGHVVAVTGDGVNDAPAIKQSDVGVAMGITGTDVAKEASDMILTDDNYATLVTAVEEGRTIFDNIKAAIKYLVGCNIGEILAVVIGMLLGWPLILTPLQLLYINLVTDGLPAIALAVAPKHERIMQRKPRTRSNIFDRVDMVWFFEVSLLTAATTLVAFWLGQKTQQLEVARAFAFTTIILVQHFIFWDVRVRERSMFQGKLLKDTMFIFTFFTPLILQLFLLYVPFLSNIFHIAHISVTQLMLVILLSSTLLVFSEIRKAFLVRLKH